MEEIYNIEGIEIKVEMFNPDDKAAKRRVLSYCFRTIRQESGMSRTEFAQWLGIPYRTMQEWELERRTIPEYLLRLIAYKVYHELKLPGQILG